jgi:hypothetical protein
MSLGFRAKVDEEGNYYDLETFHTEAPKTTAAFRVAAYRDHRGRYRIRRWAGCIRGDAAQTWRTRRMCLRSARREAEVLAATLVDLTRSGRKEEGW